MKKLPRLLRVSLILTAFPLVLASCVAETEPATNVMDDAVNLNAKVSWSEGEAGSFWFKYRPIAASGAPTGPWMETVHRSFGPMPGSGGPIAITERLRPGCEEVEGSCSQATPSGGPRTLVPNQRYEYTFCGELTASGYGQHEPPLSRCFASEVDPPPSDPPPPQPPLDTFTTLPPWGDETEDDESITCASSPPPSGACYEPPGPSTLSHSDYSFHRSDTAHLQTLLVNPPRTIVWGSFQHGRDLIFGTPTPDRAQIWQSGRYLTGPALRYDFQMKVYRRTATGSIRVVDSFQDTVPNPPGFSTGTAQSRIWFIRHYGEGPYRVRYLLIVRARDRPNPNTADGRWVLLPRTTTPWYTCPMQDGFRRCKFD